MKFDNDYAVVRAQMQKRLLAVVMVVFIALLYTTTLWRYVENWIGIPKTAATVFFASVFLVYYIYHLVAASSFILYNDEEGKIILRSYQLNMFNTSKNSYEIPKSEFKGYSISSRFMGIRKDLTLFRKHQGKTVKYPPVSISLLSPIELNKLKNGLGAHGPFLK
ncbi:MAG TPA: hypothetical protein DG754_13310 [Bacteroidales bacterium]|jgi:hypothetical protein|nr:hypothetical protein [Bacteroidales bacterium]